MATLFLVLQGGLVGMLAGYIYPDWTWDFYAIIIANTVLTLGYGWACWNDED